MDILTLGLGRVLGLELGREDVPGLKNTGVNFLASGRSRQDVADPTFLCFENRMYSCHGLSTCWIVKYLFFKIYFTSRFRFF